MDINRYLTPTVALAVILTTALGFRLGLNLFHDAMLGVDGGAYLLSVNAVLGEEPTGAGFPRPPLAPGWLLVPFIELFGTDNGYKIWAAVFSLCPLIPIYLLTKKYVGAWPAVFATGIASLDWYRAEMMVTGALPLIGFGLIGMAWWSLSNLITDSPEHRTRNIVILGASIALIPWINQTSAGLAIIILPVYALALLWFNRHTVIPVTVLTSLAPPVIIGGAFACLALPWYTEVLPGSPILTYQGPILYPAAYWDFVWEQVAFTLPLGVLIVWKVTNPGLRTLGVVVVALSLIMPWLSFDETIINIPYRARYLVAVAFYPCAFWVVINKWIPAIREYMPKLARPVVVGATTLTVFALLIGYQYQHEKQTFYADMATPETQTALEILKLTDPTANVASNSFTLSLWVAALNKVKSPFAFTAPPPPAYVEDDENLRCLLNWVPGCDVALAQQRLDVGYILVDERFPDWGENSGRHPENYLAPPDQWRHTKQAEWLNLIYASGTTRLYRIEVN